MLITDLQERLDALAYPPTHCYRIEDMTPTDILARRARIVEAYIKRCETRGAALEIGFNKGFFLHFLGQRFDVVDGCEPWGEYCEIVEDIRRSQEWSHLRNIFAGSFLDMPWSSDEGLYDFIFLGNCMHYLFRESCDYRFVELLAKRSAGLLLIEGFTSLDGSDPTVIGSRRKWPIEAQRAFTDEAFAAAMAPWFEHIEDHPSPTGPDRRFMLFRRRLPSQETRQ